MRPIDADFVTHAAALEFPEVDAAKMRWLIAHIPTIDAVPRSEYEEVLKRLRHLLKSKFIRSFDAHDRKKHTYARDISEADSFADVIHCKDCAHYRPSPFGHPTIGWCMIDGKHRGQNFYCANGDRRDQEE